MKKRLLMIIFVLVFSCNLANAKELYTAEYTVQSGDTLTSIAEQFITPDRYLPEFAEGIFQLNYDTMQGVKEVKEWQILKINYWR
jgi:hypothetical protein